MVTEKASNPNRVISLLLLMCFATAAIPAIGFRASPDSNAHDTPSGGRVVVASVPSRESSVNPALSLAFLEKMGVMRLREASLTGQGITVGVVDTGIDPSRFGSGVIADWVDLTAEGTVKTDGPFSIRSGTVEFKGIALDVSRVVSRSGYVRIGEWSASNLPSDALLRQTLGPRQPLLVLVSDRNSPGTYDTVYIDANEDRVFSPGEELPLYSRSRAFLPVYAYDESHGPLVVVMSAIMDNGRGVVLGFDGHGHGTAAASVLAGREEGYEAICPAVRILAIKAVDSTGMTTWELVSRGIDIAVDRRADVILVSIAPKDPSVDSPEVSRALKRAAGQSIVVMAAGNAGPGLGSLPQYAGSPGAVVVGGYLPSESQHMLGLSLGQAVFWPWSSCGPNSRGVTVDLVAPAAYPALLPAWGWEEEAYVLEGTSAAAACVAGVAALLTERARSLGRRDLPDIIRRALVEGARPIAGIQIVEQGAGALDAWGAAELLPVLESKGSARIVFKWDDSYQPDAFWDRSRTPGMVPFRVDNLFPFPLSLELSYPEWLRLKSDRLNIAAVDQVSSVAWFEPQLAHGLYSGFLIGDDPSRVGTELRALITMVKPREWIDRRAFSTQALLQTGAIRREYFRIASSVETLTVIMDVGTLPDGRPRGRGSLFVYDPRGNCVYQGAWVGAGAEGRRISCQINLPTPGTWEMVIISDPQSQLFGTSELLFKLSVGTAGLVCDSEELAQANERTEGQAATDVVLHWRNLGAAFTGRLALSDAGSTFLVQKRIWVSRTTAAVESLPRVEEGTEYLYVSMANPEDPAVSMVLYLYRYEASQKKWVEAASSSPGPDGPVTIFVKNPPPGDYVAYLEVTGCSGDGTHVQWAALGGRSSEDWEVLCDGTPAGIVMWGEGESRTLDLRPKQSAAPGSEASLLLAIWDTATGTLRGFLPIRVQPPSKRPVVALLSGQTVGELQFVTLRAWDRTSGKPVDACVSVGGVWYQLFRGEATFIAPVSDINGPIQVVFKGITFSIQKSFSGSGPH